MKWVLGRLPVRNNIFLVHGEEGARLGLTSALESAGIPGDKIYRPTMGETMRLTPRGAKTERVRARVDVAAVATADWHNVYADTVIALRRSLDSARDEQARRKLLERVRASIRPPP